VVDCREKMRHDRGGLGEKEEIQTTSEIQSGKIKI
jgi:hypothetical protein